ncbi:MAG: glycosyltransferase family 39 protein [Anaerolineales bacterium]|nr:glycosyltransferase family 39 protein [Anaerolineales bacterium]
MPDVSRLTSHVSRLTFYLAHRLDGGLILAALLPLFIIQSLLQPGLPTLADLPIHLYRTLEYGQAWGPGVIVPRWAPNLAYGYGYPLFVFAPPLPYWLGLLFAILGFSLETAFKLLIILTILLYAIGMYLLGRDLWGRVEAGLVAATAYAFAPFALREALLYGGNVPQYLAIGLFPWTMWAVLRAARSRAWGWGVTAACFYAAILMSHLFQALIFTPVVGLFGLILWGQETGVRGQKSVVSSQKSVASSQKKGLDFKKLLFATLRGHSPFTIRHSPFTIRHSPFAIHHSPFPLPSPPALAAIPLGLLLAAFFWLPAFTERVFTRAQPDIYLEKSPFFVRYPHWSELLAWIPPLDARAANPYVPLSLGLVTVILAVLGFLIGVRGWGLGVGGQGSGAKGQQASILHPPSSILHPPSTVYRLPSTLFFAAVALTAIFLSLPISRSVWEIVTILQVAEFPWRMLGLANLGLAVLAGGAVLWLPSKFRWPLTATCLLLQIGAIAPLLYPVTGFSRYEPVTIANQIDYERRSQSIGTTTLGEYLPQSVHRPPTTSPMIDDFLANQYPERLDRASLPAGAAATLVEQSAVTHNYNLNSPTDFTLRFWQFDYPGWQAHFDGAPALIRPEPETGLILIDVPAGQHSLTLHFGETPGRLFALFLTGLTLLGLLGAALLKATGHQPMIKGELPTQSSLAPSHPRTPALLLPCLLIIAAALWLKPLLRPVFTLDSPPGRALPAQQQTWINFAGGIQLIGYDLDKRAVRAGERVEVALYWQTDAAPLKNNLQPFVHLDRLDSLTTVAGATNYTPGDPTTETVMPTFHWDNTRYVRDEHEVIVPSDTLPIAYAVRAGLIDPDRDGRLVRLAGQQEDTALLTTINVLPAQEPPPLAEKTQASFQADDARLNLIGFELASVTRTQLDFKLAWQTDRPPGTDYTVFAQLLDLENNLVASFDRPPLDGAYPTSTWWPGQTIIDPRYIPLRGTPPGEYRLIVGLYDPATQQRLVTASGADFIELAVVKIGEK